MVDKLEWLMNYMNSKLAQLAAEPAEEFSVAERAFLRATAVTAKYDKELALLYSNEYVKISNSKIEEIVGS